VEETLDTIARTADVDRRDHPQEYGSKRQEAPRAG
jgi:hypothetical protein